MILIGQMTVVNENTVFGTFHNVWITRSTRFGFCNKNNGSCIHNFFRSVSCEKNLFICCCICFYLVYNLKSHFLRNRKISKSLWYPYWKFLCNSCHCIVVSMTLSSKHLNAGCSLSEACVCSYSPIDYLSEPEYSAENMLFIIMWERLY